MVKITCIEFDGTEHVLNVYSGQSLMQAAVGNSVRGIIGDCGGACSCATCHVYLDSDWIDRVGEKSETEMIMLEEVCDPRPNSRLSCQIQLTEELDGLIVHLPEKQV